jgi:hypothetical protein
VRLLNFPVAKTYLPYGSCIYCGAQEGKFTLEHIIPYALDGELVLPDAVCEPCQKITSWAETQCLRETFLTARAKAGIRTRKPRQRPTVFPIGVVDEGQGELPTNMEEANFRWSDLPLSEHPAPIMLPVLPKAGLLSGVEYGNGLSVTGLAAHSFQPQAPEKPDGQCISLVPFRPDAFARMLAKIAHGLVVAELGLDALEPILPEYIIGGRADYSRVIGSTSLGRILRNRTVHVPLHRDREFITAHIQLFAKYLRIPFEVVVGRMLNMNHYIFSVTHQARIFSSPPLY